MPIIIDRTSFTPWRPEYGKVFDCFAFDSETTLIDDERPNLTPSFVLGAACDGRQGFFITPDHLLPFLQFHSLAPFICHNAAFDLRVIDAQVKPSLDIYAAVEANRVHDTMILQRLLHLATAGNTARGESSLADCCRIHLGIDLDKQQTDANGNVVRTNFGQFLGQPPATIPAAYLSYLAKDVVATWQLYQKLKQLVQVVLANCRQAFGYVDDAWLQDAIDRFGPLTHHIQLRAAILMDVLRANGIQIDQERRGEKEQQVRTLMAQTKERLRTQGYLPGEPGSDKALQSILSQLKRQNPGLPLQRTASNNKWSTKEEDLAVLASEEPFFGDLVTYRACQKLASTYLRKMGRSRLHPRFGFLLETGRTYCGGGFNLQNLPRESKISHAAGTIRGCFVPAPGHVFIDSDFSQIELVVLGYALDQQLGLGSSLARLINQDQDVHRLIAGKMLGKQPGAVSKEERSSVKAISFGRPGGMGAERLRQVAKNGYGIDLTEAEVEQRIDAYHQLCPELDAFLQDEVNSYLVLAQKLQMTPRQYALAVGKDYDRHNPDMDKPRDWLGGMLLKVLEAESPVTKPGRPYSDAEIDYFWGQAQQLQSLLSAPLAEKLRSRTPDWKLRNAVRDWAGRRPVMTLTGRLRANTSFCSGRNTLFQGPAADGAILALWKVWRDGYRIVDFVHDQLVVECLDDADVLDQLQHIEELMKDGMAEVIPGMKVKVESVVSRSLNKADQVVPPACGPAVNGPNCETKVLSCADQQAKIEADPCIVAA